MPVEMTEAQIEKFLSEQTIGRLGLIDRGTPYVVPISYVFKGGYVYAHSGEGRKTRALRSHPEICFEVDDPTKLVVWTSVISWGTFEPLIGEDARYAMGLLLDRFAPMFASMPAMANPGAQARMMRALNLPQGALDDSDHTPPVNTAVIFRIKLHTMTGRAETMQTN